MFKKYSKSLLAGLCISLLSVSVWAKSTQEAVVFSIKPVALIYAAISGLAVEPAQVIYSARLNMHDYQLSVEDLKKIDKADRIYWLGPAVEHGLEKLQSRFTRQHWQALLGPVTAAENQQHAWLNPAQLERMINAMAEQLIASHPTQSVAITARREQLLQALDARLAYWHKRFAPYQQQAFLLGHSAFNDFFHALGLDQGIVYSIGHSHGQKALGAKESMQIQQRIKMGEIHCAFEEPDVSFAGLQKRFPTLQRVELEPMASSQAFDATGLLAFIDASAAAIASCMERR